MMTLPPDEELAVRLSSLFGAGLRVITRKTLGTGTFPKECVGLESATGSALPTLFIKYEAGVEHDDFGHRGGVGYEARVYEQILIPAGLGKGAFIASLSTAQARETWLVLRYLGDAARISKVPGGEAVEAAAGWVGRLHRSFEGGLASLLPSWLIQYDSAYLASWASRARTVLGRIATEDPLIARLFDRFQSEGIGCLVRFRTLAHGEYYSKNVLWADRQIVPVDWESAAAGAGEIDLAMLLEGWPDRLRDACIAQYAAARWSGDAPPGFAERFFWARVYANMRWISDLPPGAGRDVARLGELRDLGGNGFVRRSDRFPQRSTPRSRPRRL